MKKVIKSERSDMNDRDYTRHAIGEAAAWGSSVEFHLRDIRHAGEYADHSQKQAIRHARLAARWALKVMGREVAK